MDGDTNLSSDIPPDKTKDIVIRDDNNGTIDPNPDTDVKTDGTSGKTQELDLNLAVKTIVIRTEDGNEGDIDYKALYEESQQKNCKTNGKVSKTSHQTDVLYEMHETSKAEYQKVINDYENAINEKNEEIATQKEVIKCYGESACTSNVLLNKVCSNNDIFRMIPKWKGSSKNIDANSFKCEYPGCDLSNVDLIKCNLCSKWVCEECNEVPISKLKPIMNKCKTLYFICNGYDETNHESSKNRTGFAIEKIIEPVTEDANNNVVKSFQDIFENKMIQMESKLQTLIDTKLGQNMETLTKFSERMEEQTKASDMPNAEVALLSSGR